MRVPEIVQLVRLRGCRLGGGVGNERDPVLPDAGFGLGVRSRRVPVVSPRRAVPVESPSRRVAVEARRVQPPQCMPGAGAGASFLVGKPEGHSSRVAGGPVASRATLGPPRNRPILALPTGVKGQGASERSTGCRGAQRVGGSDRPIRVTISPLQCFEGRTGQLDEWPRVPRGIRPRAARLALQATPAPFSTAVETGIAPVPSWAGAIPSEVPVSRPASAVRGAVASTRVAGTVHWNSSPPSSSAGSNFRHPLSEPSTLRRFRLPRTRWLRQPQAVRPLQGGAGQSTSSPLLLRISVRAQQPGSLRVASL
jgi:hypothetical protein